MAPSWYPENRVTHTNAIYGQVRLLVKCRFIIFDGVAQMAGSSALTAFSSGPYQHQAPHFPNDQIFVGLAAPLVSQGLGVVATPATPHTLSSFYLSWR